VPTITEKSSYYHVRIDGRYSLFCKYEMQNMIVVIAFRKLWVKITQKLMPCLIPVPAFSLY
jgi:hypothetical protein